MNFRLADRNPFNQRQSINKLFLAEGDAEVGFINQYLTYRAASPSSVGVYCFKGIDKLSHHRDALVSILDTELGSVEAIAGLGLLADSETNAAGRLESAIDFLKAFGFAKCASDLLAQGQHVAEGRRAAISLSPRNNENGRIENLILQEIRDSSEWECWCEPLLRSIRG